MRQRWELLFYVTFGAGLAFGTSSFTMLSGLFKLVPVVGVVLAIWLAGLFCVLIASSVAELASMYPSSPGVRTYLKAAFSEQISMLLVFLYLIFMVLIAGVESYMFALVLGAVFPDISAIKVVLTLIWFTVFVNLIGFELPRLLQILCTLLLILIIGALGAFGTFTDSNVFSQSPSYALDQISSEMLLLLPGAVGMAVYLFIGFEWITMLGFNPQSYRRKIPISMPLAILANVLTYSLFVIGMSAQVPRTNIIEGSVPHVIYFTELLGPTGAIVAWVLALLAIFTTFNAGILGGSRLIYALTKEGKLPGICGTMSTRTGAPLGGIFLLGSFSSFASVIVVLYKLELLTAIVGSCIVCFVYAAFMLAVIRLRQQRPTAKRVYKTPVSSWLQWAIIVGLPLFGLLSLFSQPTLKWYPVVGTSLLVFTAWLLTVWSLNRTSSRPVSADG